MHYLFFFFFHRRPGFYGTNISMLSHDEVNKDIRAKIIPKYNYCLVGDNMMGDPINYVWVLYGNIFKRRRYRINIAGMMFYRVSRT